MSNPIALQISDCTLRTLTTSAQPSPQSDAAISQAQALNALTTTSITTFETTARRLGYGLPQRLMIETTEGGEVLLQSYLSPTSMLPRPLVDEADNRKGYLSDLLDVGRPSTSASHQTSNTEIANLERPIHPLTNGFGTPHLPVVEESPDDESVAVQPPPDLYATVVARRADLREARVVLTNIERVSRQLQREWLIEQVVEREQAPRARPTDDNVAD